MQNSKFFSIQHPAPDIFTTPLLSSARIQNAEGIFGCQLPISLVSVDLEKINALANLADFYLNLTEREKFAGFRFQKRKIEWLAGRIAAKTAALSILLADKPPCPGAGTTNDKNWSPRPKKGEHKVRPYGGGVAKKDVGANLVFAHCSGLPVTGQTQQRFSDKQDWHGLQIRTTAAGRPFCRLADYKSGVMPDISITHSGSIAAALACRHKCGLDLQRINDTINKVKDRFAAPVEREILRANNHDLPGRTLLTILWAAKEAVRKAFPMEPLPGFLELQLAELNAKQGDFNGRFSCQHPDMPTDIKFYCFLHKNYAGAIIIR